MPDERFFKNIDGTIAILHNLTVNNNQQWAAELKRIGIAFKISPDDRTGTGAAITLVGALRINGCIQLHGQKAGSFYTLTEPGLALYKELVRERAAQLGLTNAELVKRVTQIGG